MQSEVRGETEESPTILSYGKGFLYMLYHFIISYFFAKKHLKVGTGL